MRKQKTVWHDVRIGQSAIIRHTIPGTKLLIGQPCTIIELGEYTKRVRVQGQSEDWPSGECAWTELDTLGLLPE